MTSRSRRLLQLTFVIAILLFFFFHHSSQPFVGQLRNYFDLTKYPQYYDDADSPTKAAHSQPANPPKLGKHRYRPDGLLDVNEDGSHPIYELISRAEEEWNKKLQRSSETLRDAVTEYVRRYKRPPPKGFDLWWDYATKHNVLLPDEYDRIYKDLEAFWGIEPEDLIKIHEENESKIDSYTIGKTDGGELGVLTYAFENGKYDQLIERSVGILELYKPIQAELPDFRMTISPHDGPNRLSDYGVKRAALAAAESQTHITRDSLPKVKSIGWVSACSPNSPARREIIDLDNPPPISYRKTFIWDHEKAMDICNHPEHFYRHGLLVAHGSGPGPAPQKELVPEFSYSSTTIHHNILIPIPYGWLEDIYPRSKDPVWDSKRDERLLWRGSNTGIYYGRSSRWRQSHRSILVEFANDLEGAVQVLAPNRTMTEKVGDPVVFHKSRINPAMMDIAFSGRALACDPEICEILPKVYNWREPQSMEKAGNYKYVIDVDGNGWSGRFKRLMTSNSLVFKSTIFPEWYVDRIAPWVHYIPIQTDLSDLYDALLFFSGDGNGDGAHEDLARKIASAGRQWSKKFWRKEDLTAYLYRLTLEYARVMSPDRESMNYKYQ